jgi:hypothetical protein
MSNKECETLWDQVMGHLSRVDGKVFWAFRDQAIQLLVAPDAAIEMDNAKNQQSPGERWN